MHRILVVEDEKEITRILTKYLQREGYRYDVCHDGFCAWSCLRKISTVL